VNKLSGGAVVLLFSLVGPAFASEENAGPTIVAENDHVRATMARTTAERDMTDAQPQDFLQQGQFLSDLRHRKIDVGAVINRAFAAGAQRVRIPCGDYLITTTIKVSDRQTLMGDGMCTALFASGSEGDVIDAKGSFATIRDIRLVNAHTKSGGAVIAANQTFHLVIEHIDIDSIDVDTTWWNGIALYGANDTHINDSEIRPGGRNAAVQLSGTPETGRSEDSYISHTNINGWKTNLELSWSSGAYLSNMDVLSAKGSGVLFDPSSSQEVDGTRAVQVLSDSNEREGWFFAGVGAITETNLSNCWSATNGYLPNSSKVANSVDGLLVSNERVDNLTISGSEFHSNTGNGININVGKNIIIMGNSLFMNGVAGAAALPDLIQEKREYDGILIEKGASHVLINSNIGGYGGIKNTEDVNHQRFLIENRSKNYISISSNIGNRNWGGVLNSKFQTEGNVSIDHNIGD